MLVQLKYSRAGAKQEKIQLIHVSLHSVLVAVLCRNGILFCPGEFFPLKSVLLGFIYMYLVLDCQSHT